MASELIKAIEEQCSIEELQKILANLENVNLKNSFGETALAAVIRLCTNGCPRKDVDSNDFEFYILKAVKLIIQAGVDVDSQDRDGYNALHRAVQKKNQKVVKCLIVDTRCDVNLKNKYDQTVLHLAVKKNQVDIIQLLLQRNGIDVNSQDRDGLTALHFAVQKKNKEAIECLIEAGSDVNFKNKYGQTALHLAVADKCNRIDIIRFLLKHGVDVNSQDYNGFTALHLAVKKQNEDVVECLIDAGADVNLENKKGQSVIRALISNHKQKEKFLEILEKLIKAGADVKTMNKYGRTALHLAADNYYPHQVDFIRFLLQHDGVDVDLRDRDGLTALHRAILKENKDVIQCFIDAGTDINKETRTGDTPLHLAARDINVDLIKYLIIQGANVNAKNKMWGRTPLHMVMYTTHMDGALKGNELLLAQAEALEVLLSAGADVNAVEISDIPCNRFSFQNHKNTSIDLKTTESVFKILKIFKKYRADFKIKNLDVRTPMVIFLENCLGYRKSNYPVIVLEPLIKYRLIDVDSLFFTSPYCFRTILHEFCHSLNYDVMKFLVNFGTNINSKNSRGETPLLMLIKGLISRDGTSHDFKALDYFLSLNPDVNVIADIGLHILNLDYFWSMDYPEFLWKALIEYIAKRKSTGYLLHDTIQQTISKKVEYKTYLDKCTEELASLQELKFPSSRVNLHDILMDCKEKLDCYAKNKELVQEFNKLLPALRYPIYGPFIKKRFSKAIQKLKIMEKSAVILSSCLPCLLDPSHIVIWKIISYLKGKHLRYLCEPESEVLKIKIKIDELKISFDKYFCNCYESE